MLDSFSVLFLPPGTESGAEWKSLDTLMGKRRPLIRCKLHWYLWGRAWVRVWIAWAQEEMSEERRGWRRQEFEGEKNHKKPGLFKEYIRKFHNGKYKFRSLVIHMDGVYVNVEPCLIQPYLIVFQKIVTFQRVTVTILPLFELLSFLGFVTLLFKPE